MKSSTAAADSQQDIPIHDCGLLHMLATVSVLQQLQTRHKILAARKNIHNELLDT
jgi:hypothetical protein